MKTKIIYVFVLTILASVLTASAQMRVHFINVGQGCATLIEFPCAAILVDAGGENDSLFNSSDSLQAYLEDFFDERTDLNHTLQCVYLTHPHSDHTLGTRFILEPPYVIKNAVTDGLETGSGKTGQIKLHRAAQHSEENADSSDDIGFEAVTTSEIGNNGLTDRIIDPVNCSGTNPVIKILWGTSAVNPGWSKTNFNNLNNHSLVIRIEYGASSVLITGDLEETAIRDLLSKYNGTNLLDADVYIAGHHGSKNGTTQALLNAITPRIALIGCGDPDRKLNWTAWAYGHPDKGVLDMLQSTVTTTRTPIQVQAGTGAKNFVTYSVTKAIYATGWDGNVDLEADNSGHWNIIEKPIVPGLVNINTASLFELETLPGIGAVKAQAIIDFRTGHGSFTSIDGLDNVPGIGPATISLVKPYVKVQ